MTIMRGDARTVDISLCQRDKPLTPDEVDDLEVCVGSGKLRRTYRAGEVGYDPERQKWTLRLSQEDTFRLISRDHDVICRVKYKNAPDFDVRGICVGQIHVVNTYSEEVL